MLFPSKMEIAKITVPTKYTRDVTKELQDLGCVEFIDVEHKAHGIIRSEQEHREEIFDLHNRVTALIDILDLDKENEPKKKVQVDDTKLENILNFTRNLLQRTEDVVIDLRKKKTKIEKIIELTEHLGIDITQMEGLGKGEYFTTVIGYVETEFIPQIKWKIYEVTDGLCYFDPHKVDEYESFILTTSLNEYTDAMRRVLGVYGFKELDTSFIMDKDERSLSSEGLEERKEKYAAYEEQLSEIKESYGLELLAAEELLMIEKKNMEITKYFKETPYDTTIMWGWAPKSKQKNIIEVITAHQGAAEFKHPKFKEEEFPTDIEHTGFFAPLANLVKSYGTPAYSELDPALFMLFTFPLIFGMMFADVGHGAVLTICSILALYAKRKKISVNEFVDYFTKGAELLLLCGISSVFWGFVFGSVFGDHFGSATHPAHPETVFGEILQEHNPTFWFNPMGHGTVHIFGFELAPIMGLLILSFVVAALHITLGLILRFILLLKDGHILEAFTVPLMLIWLYWGALYVVYNTMEKTRFSINIDRLMSNSFQLVVLVVVPLIILMMGVIVEKGGEGCIEGVEYVLSLLANTISYGRILALNAIHGVLSSLILINLNFGVPYHLMGIILGTVVVGIMEGLLAFVHTLRLHWVEWFSKFYLGTGKDFVPFKTERKFTQIPSSSI